MIILGGDDGRPISKNSTSSHDDHHHSHSNGTEPVDLGREEDFKEEGDGEAVKGQMYEYGDYYGAYKEAMGSGEMEK